MDGVLHRALGLTDEEAEAIEQLLGREPNHLELALYAVMWSEHCSYKSSKVHLRRRADQGQRDRVRTRAGCGRSWRAGPERVKGLLEEQLSLRIAALLSSSRFDVVAAAERDDLIGASDRALVEVAWAEQRVVTPTMSRTSGRWRPSGWRRAGRTRV